MTAQTIEQGFHLVGQFGDVRKTEGCGPTFDRMGAAEDAIELFIVGVAQIQIEQHLLHLVKVLARFLEKDLIELAQVEVSACARSFLISFRHDGFLST